MLYKKILLIIFVPILFSCLIPNFKKAKETSTTILKYLYSNDWNAIWDITSRSYRKDIKYDRFINLKEWIERELGTIQTNKLTNFYSGSSFGVIFFEINYDASFTNGVGKIKIGLIQDNGCFKINKLEFCKIPVY